MVGHDGHAPCMLPAPIVYSRSGLLLLQSCARPPIDACVVERARQLCVRRHRGRRAGRAVQARACRPPPTLRSAGNGAYVIARNRPPARVCVYGSDRRNVKVIPTVAHRHARPVGRDLVFGSLNVRSLSPVKLDDLLVEIRDRSLDVTLLCETWHDADSVAIRRLRAVGFRVVERARPRPRDAGATLCVNHGGVAVVAAAGIRLTAIDVGFQPSTFECVGLLACHLVRRPVSPSSFTAQAHRP